MHELMKIDPTMQLTLACVALVGVLVGWVAGALIGKSRLQKSRLESEHAQALFEQALAQKLEKIDELNGRVSESQQTIEVNRQLLTTAERNFIQAQEQLKHQQRLQEALFAEEKQVAELQLELKQEHGQAKELKARLEAAERETKEKVQLLQEAKDQLKHEFQNIAQKLFEDKSEKFTLQNKQNLGEILSPLKDQLSDFKKKVEDVYDKESRDRIGLLQEIVSLKELNFRMSEDAINLTKALKGDSKAQGNWGEMVLEKVLEASGLQKGREYQTQGSYSNENGQRLRPDVIVHLPENKQVVIDSKVSLTSWERFTSVQDEEQSGHLQAHVESIKKHIKELSAKNYPDLYGINTPDYVLMFIPIEPAFLKALEVDSALFSAAFEKNIMLVCPSTLLVTLKTIHTIWRYEHQNRNALEIAQRAGSMHDQFVLFLESLEDIGDKISKANEAYEIARKRIATGKGNLIRRVSQLESLGAKAKKTMPASYREDAAPDQLEDELPGSQNAAHDLLSPDQ
ncbi:DNA recombination protein RmuC [Ketobacter sp.]